MTSNTENNVHSSENKVPLTITKGFVLLYYCFDAGYEIQIGHLEKIRGKTPRQSFLPYTRLTPSYIQYKVPPLLIRLGKKKLSIDGNDLEISIDAKVYDFGVVTIRFALPITGTLSQLDETALLLTESKVLHKRAVSEFLKIKSDITQSIIKPREGAEKDLEDYAIFMVQNFDKEVDSLCLLQIYGFELAQILRGEKNLSRDEMQEALKNPLSYRQNDLTLIDWNAAFIFDPEASYDVPDVVEFALIQLLELRLYDYLMDAILDEAYDVLTPMTHRIFPFSGTLHKISQMKLDISEIIDRLEKHLKLIGDLYLAKVYETASKRFYLEHWKSAVRGKLSTIESIYSAYWGRIQTNRMIVLEAAIVALLVIDIIIIVIEIIK